MVPPGGCPCGGIHWQAGSFSVNPRYQCPFFVVLHSVQRRPPSPPSCPGKAMASIQGIDALLILDFQYSSFQLPVHLQGTNLGFLQQQRSEKRVFVLSFFPNYNITFLPSTLSSPGGIRPMPKVGFSHFPCFPAPLLPTKGAGKYSANLSK